MKKILILPYFGKLPNYFSLYLLSCKLNPTFNWLLLTDDHTNFDYPNNVKVVYLTFDELRQYIQCKFDFELSLKRPHKLCDFKPAYGYIFEDYIKEYDFWGHCDPDCIWGDLSKFITAEILSEYDKILILGHLTLYRNTPENNMRFTCKCKGETDYYKQVFSTDSGLIFDEQYIKSINNIYEDENFPMYASSDFVADISPYHKNLRLSIYNFSERKYSLESVKKQIFVWDNGVLKRFFQKNNLFEEQEFAYIHLQKRRMKPVLYSGQNLFIIRPQEFVFSSDIDRNDIYSYYHYYLFNTQYLRVKYQHLRARIIKLYMRYILSN